MDTTLSELNEFVTTVRAAVKLHAAMLRSMTDAHNDLVARIERLEDEVQIAKATIDCVVNDGR